MIETVSRNRFPSFPRLLPTFLQLLPPSSPSSQTYIGTRTNTLRLPIVLITNFSILYYFSSPCRSDRTIFTVIEPFSQPQVRTFFKCLAPRMRKREALGRPQCRSNWTADSTKNLWKFSSITLTREGEYQEALIDIDLVRSHRKQNKNLIPTMLIIIIRT